MKELIFDQTGTPQEVLYLKESEMPQAKPHEVLIRVTARNINPSDIMFVRGMYGITPKLPSSAGFEVCGVAGWSAGFIGGLIRVFPQLAVWRCGLWGLAASPSQSP